jgi:hypothetical protein
MYGGDEPMTSYGRFARGGQGRREANSETGRFWPVIYLNACPWEGRNEDK